MQSIGCDQIGDVLIATRQYILPFFNIAAMTSILVTLEMIWIRKIFQRYFKDYSIAIYTYYSNVPLNVKAWHIL